MVLFGCGVPFERYAVRGDSRNLCRVINTRHELPEIFRLDDRSQRDMIDDHGVAAPAVSTPYSFACRSQRPRGRRISMIDRRVSRAVIRCSSCSPPWSARRAPPTWSRSRRRPGIDTSPQGKEVDGIYGDFALANDQIMSVVAHPKRGPQRQHDRPRRRRLPDRPDPPRSPERPALGLLSRCTASRPEVRRDRGRGARGL